MTIEPRDRFVANTDLKNDFVTSFKVLTREDVIVHVDGEENVAPTVTLTTDNYAQVHFEMDRAEGDVITIYRKTSIDSSDIYVEGQPLRAASLNAEHQRVSMLLEDMEMRVGNSLRRPEYDSEGDLIIPDSQSRAGKFLAFDSDGNVVLLSQGFEFVEEFIAAMDEAIATTDLLDSPLTTDMIGDGAITQQKIDPAVMLGGPSYGAGSVIRSNQNYILEDVTLPAGENGMTAGPIEIKNYNDLQYSEDFTQSAWTNNGNHLTVTTGTAQAPDGNNTATTIAVATSDQQERYLWQEFVADTVRKNTVSIHAKANQINEVTLGIFSDDTHIAQGVFNLSDGSYSSAIGDVADMQSEALADGWYRLSVQAQPSAPNCRIVVFMANDVVATANDGLYIWGAQATTASELVTYYRTDAEFAGPAVTIDGEWSIV